MSECMKKEQIGWLSEIAAKSANRAIEKGALAGNDHDLAHFVDQVKAALSSVPVGLRGDWATQFLSKYKDGAYGASVAAHNAFEEKLRIEEEVIFAARREGALAYKEAVRTGEPAECPYNPEKSGDPLDDIRMTAWFDGIAGTQASHGGEKFEVLGNPIVATLETEHADGTATYSIPAPTRAF